MERKSVLKELEPDDEDDTSNDRSAHIHIAALHQSSRNDLEHNYNGEDSLTQQVNEDFKKAHFNNTVVIERKIPDEPGSRNPAVEYLETCQDVDDDNFFKVTNPGISEEVLLQAGKGGIDNVLKFLQKYDGDGPIKSNYTKLSKVLNKIHRILEKIDTTGTVLTDVFHLNRFHQKYAFKMFIISLDIWG